MLLVFSVTQKARLNFSIGNRMTEMFDSIKYYQDMEFQDTCIASDDVNLHSGFVGNM